MLARVRKTSLGLAKISPTPLVFRQSHKGRIKIAASALSVMLSFVQNDSEKTEAGGILLGRHIRGTDDVVVDHVTVPMPGDRRSRFSFFRAEKQHQRVIDDCWKATQGTCTYLGEWHTHPEPVPSASRTDLNNWRRKLMHDHFFCFLFFAIVGTEEVCVWQGYHRCSELVLLEKDM